MLILLILLTPMRTSNQAAGSQPEPSWSAVGKSGQARKKLVEKHPTPTHLQMISL